MENRQSVPLSAFAIAILCFFKTHKKGTVLFFKSEEEHGKLIIEDGEIVALQYNGKESEEALRDLNGLSAVRYRCYSYRLPPKNRFHISFKDFFKSIGNLDLTKKSDEPQTPQPELKQTPQPEPKQAPTPKGSFTTALESLKEALHDALGPISDFIYGDILDEMGPPISLDQFEAVSEKLAQEIDNPAHRKQFQDKSYNITGSIVYSKARET